MLDRFRSPCVVRFIRYSAGQLIDYPANPMFITEEHREGTRTIEHARPVRRLRSLDSFVST